MGGVANDILHFGSMNGFWDRWRCKWFEDGNHVSKQSERNQSQRYLLMAEKENKPCDV